MNIRPFFIFLLYLVNGTDVIAHKQTFLSFYYRASLFEKSENSFTFCRLSFSVCLCVCDLVQVCKRYVSLLFQWDIPSMNETYEGKWNLHWKDNYRAKTLFAARYCLSIFNLLFLDTKSYRSAWKCYIINLLVL